MERYTCKAAINSSFVKKDGTAALSMVVYINGKKLSLPLGLNWPPEYFSVENGLLLPRGKKDQQYSDYNMVITSTVQKINEIFIRYRLMEKTLTTELFKIEYSGYVVKNDFVSFFKRKLDERYKMREIDRSTWVTQTTSLNSLRKFSEFIPFNSIDKELIRKYILHLKKLKLHDNTIWVRIKDVKVYMNIARRENVNFDWPFDKMSASEKPAQKQSRRVYLSSDDVRALHNYLQSDQINIFQKPILVKFLFSCFTGLRISDMQEIQKMEVINGNLIFAMRKNRTRIGKLMKVPISGTAKNLMEKYEEDLMRSYAEPVINRTLKGIQKATGIKHNLTFHVARHTFATLFLERGGKIEVLSEILGHSNIKTTMIYVHLTNEHKMDQVKLMDGIL